MRSGMLSLKLLECICCGGLVCVLAAKIHNNMKNVKYFYVGIYTKETVLTTKLYFCLQ